MILTDTHTHLYSEQFEGERELLIQQAMEKGVQRFFMPNVDSASIPGMFQVEKAFPEHCFPMMGLHPCSVNEFYQQELQVVEYWLKKRRFCAVGEIGIDLYWDKSFFDQQQDAFRRQIQLSLDYNIPFVIHSRDSFREVMNIVNEFKGKPLKAIFHCFGGTVEEANEVIAAGNFKLGIGGVLTFKNSKLADVVAAVELSKLVLETDAPYLAPTPYRGKRNDPAYLYLVAEKIAEIKGISIGEVAAITTQNSIDIFGK